MKRKQRIQILFYLVFLISTGLVFTGFSHSVQEQPILNIIDNRLDNLNNEKNKNISTYDSLLSDDYEFSYEINTFTKNNKHRIMLMLCGTKHMCKNLWNSFDGNRIVTTLRQSGYSILIVPSRQKIYDINLPISNNNDIKYIYLALQKWMNTVYYSKFKQYPFLYLYSTSCGSKFASILSRILPIQAQLLYTYSEHHETMLIPSTYDSNIQTRLILDPTFANWFYFDFCYGTTGKNMENQTLCPFNNNSNHLYPLPPTFFTNLNSNLYENDEIYKRLLMKIRSKATDLGGLLLTHNDTLQTDTIPSAELNVSYMQENFHPWHSKSFAAQLFVEHFTHPEKYRTIDKQRQTCWCSDIDFKHYEHMSNITTTWSNVKQDEYKDYVKDIKQFQSEFCEKICDDLMMTHSMISHNINRTLDWIQKMDQLRQILYIDDYIKRPLRIWMYDKQLLIKNSSSFWSKEPNWAHILKEFQMYSPEYYLQDYFEQLSKSDSQISRHHLQWTVNPLLADYFIIPTYVVYFYFYHQPSLLNPTEFANVRMKLNEDYFEILLTNIRTNYPYWTLASHADQIGANHILPIPGGRNMGIFFNKTQNILKNVVQIGFTGIRQDLLPSNTRIPYAYRNIYITYRHLYDIIIPQFTPLNINRSEFENIESLVQKKKRLFFFAGALSHSISSLSARSQLLLLWENIKGNKLKMITKIQGKHFELMTVIDGHMKSHDYLNSIESSVFSFCPEGFLPWSPRLYEAIQIGSIPIILADNIVLPFERFIDWRSFSVKINVSHIRNITSIVYGISNFPQYIKHKLKSALPYLYAFRWPYAFVNETKDNKQMFQPQNDEYGRAKNVFHYITLELRCRRLEQWYGLTVDISSTKSIEAQRLACTNHPDICPCHNKKQSVAFQEYV